MKTRLVIITMFLFTQLGFSQWTRIGNDIDGEAAFDYSASIDRLAISSDGSIVAIGAPDNDANGSASGHVRVYKNINNIWTQIGDDIDGSSRNDYFGSGVDLSNDGNIIAVGVSGNKSIKVLENINNSWSQKGNIISNSNQGFAVDIAMNADGSILATTIANSILIYKFINNDWGISKIIELPGDRNALALATLEFNDTGDVLIIGNRQYSGNNDGTEDGRVLVYQNINNDWSQKGTSIISNNNNSSFGTSVDISGDGNIIILGSPLTTINGKTEAGFVRTYKFENNDWVQTGSDINGLVNNINLGTSVNLNNDGSILAVGSSGGSRGIAQIFEFENNNWVQIHSTIVGEASNDGFGSSIALSDSGSIVAIGGRNNDGNGSNAGHVRVFKNSTAVSSNYTTIPDANFEQYLVQNNIDSEGTIDGKVLTTDIVNVTQIDVTQRNISSLAGIENFAALTYLNAFDNNISSIDVSKNTLLETLYLGSNQLSTIDITNNTNLKDLGLDSNNLTVIDITNNTELTNLIVAVNQLTNLDVSNNNKLVDLRCEANSITSLDVSNLISLENLWIFDNNISQINLTDNVNLKNITAYNNQLSILDLSKNIALEVINLHSNQLLSINIKNENNTIITDFQAQQNPNLICIEVDNIAHFSNTNINLSIDSQTNFYVNCPSITAIPDANFEAYLESINVGNNIVGDGFVNTESIQTITILNVANKNISNLTGIQDFTNLTELDCKNNAISSVDFSKNTSLEKLFISNNQLTAIDVSKNLALKNIDIGENSLTDLDVHLLENLETLSFYKNQLTEINTYSNKKLLTLIGNENQLKQVDIRENKNLFWIDVDDNALEHLTIKNDNNTKITIFSATNNPNLTCIEVDDVSFSETNWTAKDATTNFSGDCAPANDDCSDAIPLVFGQQTPGDINSGAFTNATDCVAGTIIADVWYSVTIPPTGEFSIQGEGLGGLLKFAVYESCTSNSALSCGLNISLTNLTPGDVYYLKVWMEEPVSKSANKLENGTFTIKAEESSVLSVNNLEILNDEVLVFPNPAKQFVKIQSLKNEFINTVEMFNLTGKRVFLKQEKNQIETTLNTSNITKGIYILKVHFNNKTLSKKLIIQ